MTLYDKRQDDDDRKLAVIETEDVKEAVNDFILLEEIFENFFNMQEEYDDLCEKYNVEFVNLTKCGMIKAIFGDFEK